MAPLNMNNTADRFRAQSTTGGWSWRLIIFTFFLFFIVTATYLGIEFGYLGFLNNSVTNLESEITEVASSIPDADRNNLAEFYSRLANLSTVLNAHVGTSAIFPLLEKMTHPQVVYDSFSFEMKTKELALTGRAASFEILSKQLAAYQNAAGVTRVLLQSSDLNATMVNFTVRLTLDTSVFKLQ